MKGSVHLVGALLGFVAGFVDTAGFLALGGLFTAHVTGNLVVLGARLAQQNTEGAWIRLLLLPIFVVSVAATRKLARRSRTRGLGDVATLLLVESALLVATALVAHATSGAPRSSGDRAVVLIAGLAVVAMGMQNAMMRETFGGQAPTTVMTGNVTQLTLDLVEYTETARADHEQRAALRGRIRKLGTALAGFVVGGAAGASLVAFVGLIALLLPAFVLLALALTLARPERPASPPRPPAP